MKNLKEAKSCQIAGGAKKLTGLSPGLIEAVINECGQNTWKVSRIVRKGQVYFSKEYTRMVRRNACVVLLSNGKVAEIHFFVWDKESGVTLVVYKEIEPDLDKPFFFDNAGCHILRMKPQRYFLTISSVLNNRNNRQSLLTKYQQQQCTDFTETNDKDVIVF